MTTKILKGFIFCFVFFISCQSDTLINDLEHLKTEATEFAAKKSAAYIAVENLFKEFKDDAALKLVYDDFVDYQYEQIDADSNYTVPQSDIEDLITDLGVGFQSKYQAVIDLDLTELEIKAIIADINKGRSCWICNWKACLVSTIITNGPPPGNLLGYIGVGVHCD